LSEIYSNSKIKGNKTKIKKQRKWLKKDRQRVGIHQRYTEIIHDPLLFSVAQGIF
jgi:hypothetical protein